MLMLDQKLTLTQFNKIQKCQIWHENQKPYHDQVLFGLN